MHLVSVQREKPDAIEIAHKITAQAIEDHRGTCGATINIKSRSVLASITVRPETSVLPIMRGIAADITAALSKAHICTTDMSPSVSQGEYWPYLNMHWMLSDGSSVFIEFDMSPAGAADLVVASTEVMRPTRLYAIAPADGGAFLPAVAR